jgi:hypothetical protein
VATTPVVPAAKAPEKITRPPAPDTTAASAPAAAVATTAPRPPPAPASAAKTQPPTAAITVPLSAPAPAPVSVPSVPPAPAPVVSAPPAAAPAVSNKPDERVLAFIEAIKVAGVRASGAESRALMNGRVFHLDEVVDRTLGLKLVGVDAGKLTFVDANGVSYVKHF